MPAVPIVKSGRVGRWLFDKPYLLLSLTSLFWACNTVIGRFVVGHIPPMTLAFVRWTGAFLIVLPFAARHLAVDWPVIRKQAGLMAVYALVGFSAYNTMAYYGLQYTTAINALLLQSIGPLFVALCTFAMFGDRLTLRQAGGVCVSLCGVVVIICHGSLAVLRAVAFNRGVELVGANRAAPFIHLVPVFGSVLAIVFLGERFELFHAVGYGLVFSGITIATKS